MKIGGAAPNQKRDRQPWVVVGTSCSDEFGTFNQDRNLLHDRKRLLAGIP